VAPLLPQRYEILAPDLRGHGESAPADSYRFADYAGDLAELVSGLGGRPCVLVGHSMGGYIALTAAAMGLMRPAGLFIADMKTGATAAELAAMQAASGRPGRPFASLDEAAGRYRLSPPEHAVPAERLAAVARESFREEGGQWVARFDRRVLAIEPVEPLPLVRQIHVPIRFVRGEHSAIMPRAEAAILAQAAGTELLEMAGCYHHLPLEDPAGLANLITDFLM
jgi:pimeloyl-ACP methyl ester carboxylesterase